MSIKERAYNSLIERGLTRTKVRADGLHKHRIVQGFRGGLYERGNVTLLTRREHRIVHLLLYHMFGEYADLMAYVRLGGKNCNRAGKTYEEIFGLEKGNEVRKKISESSQKPKDWWKGGKHSDETKAKISAAGQGRRKTDLEKQRISKSMAGKRPSEKSISAFTERARKPRSEEHKRKIGEARKRAWELRNMQAK